MSFRTFNGRTNSEDGWQYVDEGSCTWVEIPGTNVHLQIQNGQPLAIMRAFAADYNAFIEPLRDPDSACWTPGNSVATSNHPGGTAMDLNWESHPFETRNTFNTAQQSTINELLDWYEDMIFWGGRWKSPIDEMHWQMGYDTWGSENVARVQNFIARKVRADGFSTFRRGSSNDVPVAPPADAINVLTRATGITVAKAIEILPGLQAGLALAECTNRNRVAMALAQWGHESVSFEYTEEIASGAAYEGRADLGNTEPGDGVRFKGRTWIQVTGRAHYREFSQWAHDHGLVPTATYFVDHPTELGDVKWAGVGAAWYWTVSRPQINSLCDAGNLVAVTQAINGGQNGAPDRKLRWDRALTLGDQLLTLISPIQGDDMASVPQDQWDRVYRELTQRLPSRSPLRHLGEGLVDTVAGFLLNVDGSQHVEICKLLAGYGHPPTLALLREVASADPTLYPDRQDDAKMAQAILADVTATKVVPDPVTYSVNAVAPQAAPQVVYVDRPVAAPVVESAPVAPTTTGQVLGNAYDALEALNLSGALTDTEKAPLAALIGVLQTKTQGSAA